MCSSEELVEGGNTQSQTDRAELPSSGNFTHSNGITKSRELPSLNTLLTTYLGSLGFANPDTVRRGRDFKNGLQREVECSKTLEVMFYRLGQN